MDTKKWQEEELIKTYENLKIRNDSITRQLEEANKLVENLKISQAECFSKMQSIRAILLDEYGVVV